VETEHEQKKGIMGKLSPKRIMLIFLMLVVLSGVAFAAMEKASDNPKFCVICHDMQPYYDSWHDSNLLAKKHADAGVKCHDCHEPSVSQQTSEGIKYITGDFEKPLKQRQFSKDNCLKCHDYNDVTAKTNFSGINPHKSHKGELECYTCHSMHRQSTVLCAQCHSFSWIKKLPDDWNKTKK
jgi:hypothetical protein